VHPLLTELSQAKTTRARTVLGWYFGPVAFCIGAFFFMLHTPLVGALAVIAVLYVSIIVWVMRAPADRGRTGRVAALWTWRIAAIFGTAVTVVAMYFLNK
jgi:hypothetical protein